MRSQNNLKVKYVSNVLKNNQIKTFESTFYLLIPNRFGFSPKLIISKIVIKVLRESSFLYVVVFMHVLTMHRAQ